MFQYYVDADLGLVWELLELPVVRLTKTTRTYQRLVYSPRFRYCSGRAHSDHCGHSYLIGHHAGGGHALVHPVIQHDCCLFQTRLVGHLFDFVVVHHMNGWRVRS